MKSGFISLFIGCLCLFISHFSDAQANNSSQIHDALKKSDAKKITTFLHETVKYEYLGEAKIVSKTVAEFSMKDFFNKNQVESIKLIKQATNNNQQSYLLFSYVAKTGTYKIYFNNSNKNGNALIDIIKISKDEE